MKVLAVDTTSEFGSIALVDDGALLEEVAIHSPEGFAHVIFQEIEALLARYHVKITEVDCFAAASGPGSFTGVRVGLTVVKGLAEACGRKVLAVSNLRALAWFGSSALRAVVRDARRGEVYGAVYDASLQIVQDEVVMKLDAWLARLPAGVQILAQDLALDQPHTQAPRELAGAIGGIAAREFEQAVDPAEADANYVRRSDAEMLWKDAG